MGAIAYLAGHGLSAESLSDDQIAVWPETSITPEIESWIIQHKPKLIAELRQKQNPDAMLAEIAALLQADPDQLRALLSADDLDDIAQGRNSLDFMLTYFRLMRTNGQLPITAPPAPKRPAPKSAPTAADRAKAWKPAHNAMINHIMACNACYAPRQRYCEQGADLHKAYKRLAERQQG